MKRSEMITVLLDAINENQYQDYYWLPHEAERVLSILEKAGMKPKGYYGLMSTGEPYNKDLHQGREVEYFHNWEPEE